MATYYFDWDAGSDSNAGTSPATAWKSYDAKQPSTAPNDILYFKRGTTQIVTTAFLNARDGFRFLAYGSGPRPRWIAQGAALGTTLMNFSWRNNIVVEDQDFDATGVVRTIYCAAQTFAATPRPTSNITFRRCLFHNATSNGIDVIQELTTTATASNYLFEDCEFYDNGGHGSLVMGDNHVHVRCKAYRNGATQTTGSHGFSAYAIRTAVNSGWTLVSGNVYQRTLAAVEVTVRNVRDLSSTPALLTQNTSTPTTPASGQWGQSGSTLYVNVGANPNGRSMLYQWGTTNNLRYIDCEAWGNIWYPGPFTEGHGFAFDDFTSNSQWVGCISRENQGYGFSINLGSNNKILGCVAVRNGNPGVLVSSGPGNQIINSVFLDNSRTTTPGFEIAYSQSTTTNGVVTNCVLAGNATNGIQFEPTATGTVTNCAINGYTNATVNATTTGTITQNVRQWLRSDQSLVMPGNPLATAGVYVSGVTLANGRLRPGYTPVGAYMAVQPRSLRI